MAFTDGDNVARGKMSTGDLVGKVFTKSLYIGVVVPFLFAYLGLSNVLVSFDPESIWLVSEMSWIWPVLPAQYELVRQVHGAGQSASYAFMCAALWAWPVLWAAACLRAHAKSRNEILSIVPKEIGAVVVVSPIAILVLIFDVTKVASPLFGFPVHHGTLLYLRQWLVFAPTAFVLGFILYVLGRVVLWICERLG